MACRVQRNRELARNRIDLTRADRRTPISNPDRSASSPRRPTLRLTGRRADGQVSWGFRGRPVDWRSAETTEKSLSGGQLSPDLLTWPIKYASRKPRSKADFGPTSTSPSSHSTCPRSVLHKRKLDTKTQPNVRIAPWCCGGRSDKAQREGSTRARVLGLVVL